MGNTTITCPNPSCQKTNPPQNAFCQYCGTALPKPQPEISQPPAPSGARVDLLRGRITPAEGETTVRTYYCTYYKSRLLGLTASGYLSATNRRLIFHAQGESSAGTSVIQSEVPIADVSGISSYKGTYFNFGSLLLALLVSVFVSGLISSILPALLALLGLRDYNTYLALEWILGITASIVSFFIPNKSIWRSIFAATGAAVFTVIGGLSAVTGLFGGLFGNLFGRMSGGSVIALLLAFAMVIYTLACVLWYARRPTFTLAVNSKGGSSTPINISGATGIGLFDVAAGKALTAEPAEDAEPMLKELGALVLDIQTLGDYGITKWISR